MTANEQIVFAFVLALIDNSLLFIVFSFVLGHSLEQRPVD